MSDLVTVLKNKRLRAQSIPKRGNTPALTLDSEIGFFQTLFFNLGVAGVVALVVWLVGYFAHASGDLPSLAWHTGTWVFCLMVLLPFIVVLLRAVLDETSHDVRLSAHFSWGERLLANIALALLVVLLLKTCHLLPPEPQAPYCHLQGNCFFTPTLVAWSILSVLLIISTTLLARLPYTPTERKQIDQSWLGVGVWLGESTGRLAALSHQANISAQQQVGLFNDDLAQNILILGAIGSGKTTRAIHPLLIQLLEQGCGGLIFDIKGDFHQAVQHFAQLTGRHYHTIGVGQSPFNLLAGLTPEMAASFLKSAFLLSGMNHNDSFWVEAASELCRNALGVLSFLPAHYNLASLYRYIFDPDFHQTQWESITALSHTLQADEQQRLASYQRYETLILPTFDDKVVRSIKATLAQVLSPFQHPDLIQAFCTEAPVPPANLHSDGSAHWPDHSKTRLEAILEGSVFLVDMPISRWGLGAKVVYMLIKLRFFNVMQQRTSQLTWNQSRYVFFICDEYQEMVSANKDGLSDLNFWDKSRSSKTIGIISTQSISSVYAAIGHRDLAQALLQNFRQKLCFRTEDQNTIALFNQLLGTVQVGRLTTSENTGKSSSWQHNSTNEGTGKSLAVHDKPLLDGQFFRMLGTDQALAVLSIQGQGFDDVLKMQACFVDAQEVEQKSDR